MKRNGSVNSSIVSRLRTPAAFLFRKAWLEYARCSARNDGRKSTTEIWRSDGEALFPAWQELMRTVLPVSAWMLLCLVLERQTEMRNRWLRYGGCFYTKHGNRRRGDEDYVARMFKKFRPRLTVDEQDRVEKARRLYAESLRRNKLFQDSDLLVAVLVLSGYITGGPAKRTGMGFITGWRKLPKARIEELWTKYHEDNDVVPFLHGPSLIKETHGERET